ncbi:hypothetical protein EX30DRAFT_158343 [Ascodesmis nigricans]|uniref:Uncharacterized protein n=1 Tax=Ascodesmis nigricans TaxID=341454 RepID=A0A4S2MS70_9PEZI|nr:hypothetical protein EX30DRAFT_158343 [Ascodesmis nigricans]
MEDISIRHGIFPDEKLLQSLDPELLFSQRELKAYASDLLRRYQDYITICELGPLREDADTALMKFFNCIMHSGSPHDINTAYNNYYETATPPYREAVSFGWKSYQEHINQPLARLTGCTKFYVGQTLLVSFLHHRQHIRLFNDWQDVRTAIVSTTCRILQDRNPKSWTAMTQLRNEFIVCCRDVHKILLRSRGQHLRTLNYAIFENPQKAWDESVEAIAEDLQHDKLPSTLSRFVSILVQQWAKARGSKKNDENPELMARFVDNVHRWEKAAFDQGLAYALQVERFIKLVWPKWKTTASPDDARIDPPGSPIKLTDIRPLMDQFIQPTSDLDLQLSRKLLEYISTEASEVYKRLDVTVMAAVMSATFELMDWSNDRNAGILKYPRPQSPLGSPLNVPDKKARPHRESLQRLSDGVIYQDTMKFWLYSCSFLFLPKIVMKIIPFEDIIRFAELGFERLDEQLEQLEKLLPQVRIHRTKTRQVVINALYHIHLGYLKTDSSTKSFIDCVWDPYCTS